MRDGRSIRNLSWDIHFRGAIESGKRIVFGFVRDGQEDSGLRRIFYSLRFLAEIGWTTGSTF